MPKPVAAYVRISSKKGQKDDSQREAIAQWLVNNGIDAAAVEWYCDVESGRKMTRPEFDRLQRDIFAGTVKTVVVFKVDRIARRLREGLNVLCEWCDKGVRFVSITQQVDVSGTPGRMIAALMLGLAEIEWEYRRERQAAGISVARKTGIYRGRKTGTTKGKPARAAELKAKGLTAEEIATAMGVSLRTVWRYLGHAPETQATLFILRPESRFARLHMPGAAFTTAGSSPKRRTFVVASDSLLLPAPYSL